MKTIIPNFARELVGQFAIYNPISENESFTFLSQIFHSAGINNRLMGNILIELCNMQKDPANIENAQYILTSALDV
jgi:hypothetical protein